MSLMRNCSCNNFWNELNYDTVSSTTANIRIPMFRIDIKRYKYRTSNIDLEKEEYSTSSIDVERYQYRTLNIDIEQYKYRNSVSIWWQAPSFRIVSSSSESNASLLYLMKICNSVKLAKFSRNLSSFEKNVSLFLTLDYSLPHRSDVFCLLHRLYLYPVWIEQPKRIFSDAGIRWSQCLFA